MEGDPYTRPSLSSGYIQMQWVLFLIFLTEYVLRSWSCGIVSAYAGVYRYRFLVRPFMIIDLIILLLSFTEVVFTTISSQENWIDLDNFMLVMRIVQVMRLLHFERFHNAINSLLKVLHTHRYELLTAFVMMIIIIVIFSYIIFILETKYRSDSQNANIKTLFDSFYFVLISFLTIGYGDFTPTSGAGRIVTALVSLVGVAIVSLPTNIIGSGFALYVNQRSRKRHESSKFLPAVILIQRWWRTKAPELGNDSPTLKSEFEAYNRYKQKMNYIYNDFEHEEFDSHHIRANSLLKEPRPTSLFGDRNVPNIVENKNITPTRSLFSSTQSSQFTCPGGTQSLNLRSIANWLINDYREKARKTKAAAVLDVKEIPQSLHQAFRVIRFINFYLAVIQFSTVKKPYDSMEMMEEFSKTQLFLGRSVEILTTKIEMLVSRNFRNHQQLQADIRNFATQFTTVNERLTKIEKILCDLQKRDTLNIPTVIREEQEPSGSVV